MRAVVQRVKNANVKTGGGLNSAISNGLLIFVGVGDTDTDEDAIWLSSKIARLRIFDDNDGVMNLNVVQANGDILVISQFTLQAKTKKGNRPSYVKAAAPEVAIPLYNKFVEQLSVNTGKKVQTGEFGAEMDVELINHGPVTIIIDSRNKE